MTKALKYNADCLRFCAIAYDETLNTTVENIPYQYSKFKNGDFNRALDFEKDDAVLKMNQNGWSALYRRDFLLENGILFDDTLFYYEKLFFVKILTLTKHHLAYRARVLIQTVDTKRNRSTTLNIWLLPRVKSTVGCSRANVPMIFTGNSWTKNSGKSCP